MVGCFCTFSAQFVDMPSSGIEGRATGIQHSAGSVCMSMLQAIHEVVIVKCHVVYHCKEISFVLYCIYTV